MAAYSTSASALWSFDKQVWSHDVDMDRRFIDIVPFTDRWLTLALTLEFVLIQALQPAKNIAYRDYGVL